MTIGVVCPGCGKRYSLPETQLGRRARCTSCKHEFPIVAIGPPAAEVSSSGPSSRGRASPASRQGAASSTLPVDCPACGEHYELDAAMDGKRARCKSCGEVFRVAAAAAPAEFADDLYSVIEDAFPAVAAPEAPRPGGGTPAADPPRGPLPDRRPSGPHAGRSGSPREGPVGFLRYRALIALALCVLGVIAAGRSILKSFGHRANENEAAMTEDTAYAPFPDAPPGPGTPIRADVMEGHRELTRALIGATGELAATLGEMRDQASGRLLLPRMDAAMKAIDEITSRGAKLPKLMPLEDHELHAEFGQELIDAMLKQRQELERIAGLGGNQAASRNRLAQVDRAVAGLREKIAREAPVPCVDVALLNVSADEVGALEARLRSMSDSVPPKVFRQGDRDTSNGRVKVGYRIGPVADLDAFARKVDFARVASKRGRVVTLVDARASAADLAAAREEKEKQEAVRREEAALRERGRREAEARIAREQADRDAARFAKAWADFQAQPDKRRAGESIRVLAALPVNDLRAEVARELEKIDEPDDALLMVETARALSVWAGPENIPALVRLLSRATRDRAPLIAALARLDAPALAQTILPHIGTDRDAVGKALAKLGPGVEPLVLPILRDGDRAKVGGAIAFLGRVGGEASLRALEALAASKDGAYKAEAESAIRDIRSRRAGR